MKNFFAPLKRLFNKFLGLFRKKNRSDVAKQYFEGCLEDNYARDEVLLEPKGFSEKDDTFSWEEWPICYDYCDDKDYNKYVKDTEKKAKKAHKKLKKMKSKSAQQHPKKNKRKGKNAR